MKIVAALGGNAIERSGRTSFSEQVSTVKRTSKLLSSLVSERHRVVITHGNGPQVGDILLQQESARGRAPVMPLPVAGAESQGEIGYMLQQQLQNQIDKLRLRKKTATLFSQVLVDSKDPAIKKPTKFIGPFYSAKQAELLGKKYILKKQDNRGWRRVVPSPKPLKILESDAIKLLYDKGFIVICCGGGGVPVVQTKNGYKGIDAVIDKDRTAALLGKLVSADVLLILTDVDYVYSDFGGESQQKITKLKLNEALKLLSSGELPAGSMRPKVESAVEFVRSGGKKAIIANLDKMKSALKGKSGTVISK